SPPWFRLRGQVVLRGGHLQFHMLSSGAIAPTVDVSVLMVGLAPPSATYERSRPLFDQPGASSPSCGWGGTSSDSITRDTELDDLCISEGRSLPNKPLERYGIVRLLS